MSIPAPNFQGGAAAPSRPSSRRGKTAAQSNAAPFVRPLAAQTRQPVWKLLTISLLLLLLAAEWLQPLLQLAPTELYDIRAFLALFGLTLLLDGLRVPAGWSAPLKGAFCVGFVGVLFYPDKFASFAWLGRMAVRIRDDMLIAALGHYEQIGGEIRTLLFAAGWAMMLSVVHMLLVQRQQVLWLGTMTVVYLLLMQLIFGFDTTFGVLRSFTWTGLLLALLLPDLLARTRGVLLSPGRALRWTAAAAALTAVCFAAGWYGWKPAGPEGKLMRPLDYSFLERWPFSEFSSPASASLPSSAAMNAAALPPSAAAKTGYSADDSSLGGPIEPDDGIAFTARTSKLAYWRGESRDVYTGKGWRQSAARPEPYASIPPTAVSPDLTRIVRQEVTLPPPLATRLLFTAGPMLRADAMLSKQDRLVTAETLRYDAATGAYSLPELSDPIAYYRIEALASQADASLLREDRGAIPPDIKAGNTQLPGDVPERVVRLAASVTEQAATAYDKAVAVADYLHSHYRYSMSEPTVPGAKEDFVDHFLFADRVGYCDQFSTAMAVLLRAVDVPARWVKGYAPGAETSVSASAAASPDAGGAAAVNGTAAVNTAASVSAAVNADTNGTAAIIAHDAATPSEDREALAANAEGDANTAVLWHHVVIRNRDAHSWVEVYFPSFGWVPFDPTPGFSGAGMAELPGGHAAEQAAEQVTEQAAEQATVAPAASHSTTVTDSVHGPAAGPAVPQIRFRLGAEDIQPGPGSQSFASDLAQQARTTAAAFRTWLLDRKLPAAAVVLAAGAVAVLLHVCRHPLLMAALAASTALRAQGRQHGNIVLMELLWQRVYRIYGARSAAETVREYAARLSLPDDDRRKALHEFARLYELIRYDSQRRRPIPRRMLFELWRRMIAVR